MARSEREYRIDRLCRSSFSETGNLNGGKKTYLWCLKSSSRGGYTSPGGWECLISLRRNFRCSGQDFMRAEEI